jgi:hypothetical protein
VLQCSGYFAADSTNAAFEITGLRRAPLAALKQRYITSHDKSMSGVDPSVHRTKSERLGAKPTHYDDVDSALMTHCGNRRYFRR